MNKMGSFRKNTLATESIAEMNARHAKIGQLLQDIGLKALKEFEKTNVQKKKQS